jgi:uncharacterized membrane protein YgcG
MELTMTNAINAAATSERELTIDELDAVSGGGTNGGNVAGGWDLTHNTIDGGGGDIGGGGAGPAIAAWNKLLGNYGF